MKFRYKVLIINIILLSLGISTVGFFMIKKNYELAIDNQVKNAIEENNIIQSTIEYNVLGSLNNNSYISDTLADISDQASASIVGEGTCIYILYNNSLIYKSNSSASDLPETIINNQDLGVKKYLITKEDDTHYIYVATNNIIASSNYSIINRTDISSVYDMVDKQQHYFMFLLLITLVSCSLLMFIMSYFLTKPLEKLNKTSQSFGEGNYSARVNVKSQDEVGELATTYNAMAESVSNHVDELNDMIKRRDQFVADFTHEIKTPMTSIIGYSDMIRSKDLSREDQIMSASYIFNEGKRLEAMSMKLFDFIYLRDHEIDKKPFATVVLEDKVINSVTPMLDRKNITLESDFDNVILHGDIGLLTSAFINIIDNARKASNDNSKIIFKGKIIDSSYVISVQDFGIGISEENIQKICDEFFMADKSRSRNEGGAGLGLSLALSIFESHNAKLDIKSKLNVGTTMTISFSEYEEVSDDE